MTSQEALNAFNQHLERGGYVQNQLALKRLSTRQGTWSDRQRVKKIIYGLENIRRTGIGVTTNADGEINTTARVEGMGIVESTQVTASPTVPHRGDVEHFYQIRDQHLLRRTFIHIGNPGQQYERYRVDALVLGPLMIRGPVRRLA